MGKGGIRTAYDQLFNVIETRETESGVELFSRATETRSITPPSAKELDAVIKRVTARWEADVSVSLVDGFADLPADIQKAARDQGSDGSDIRGVFHQGTIYVVRDNIGIRTSGLLPSYLPVRNELLPALINQRMMISGRWGGSS